MAYPEARVERRLARVLARRLARVLKTRHPRGTQSSSYRRRIGGSKRFDERAVPLAIGRVQEAVAALPSSLVCTPLAPDTSARGRG